MDLATTMTLATHEHWSGHAGAWWPIFPLFWILFFVFLIFVFKRRGYRHWHHARHSGESVLAERYARGEISEQEYRERLEVLRRKEG